MRAIYVAALALLILAGVFLANFLSFQEQTPSILHDQAPPFESLLPQEPDAIVEAPAECSPLCAQHVPAWDSRPTPEPIPVPTLEPLSPPIPEPDVLTVQEPSDQITPVVPPPDPVTVPAPISYIYFLTGVPVQPAPTVPMPSAVVYSTGFMPVVQSYSMPVFVPRVVPSRVGSPKWVYPNGVVIKPKVYYPQQPVRNVLRGVTP